MTPALDTIIKDPAGSRGRPPFCQSIRGTAAGTHQTPEE